MPRSIWNGTIAFGLVTVPVKVYSATESKTVHFREVHAKDGGKIEHRRICPKDGEEVDYDDVVKGYEVSRGKWVELTDDEIAAAAGSRSRRLDIDHFVPFGEIDPDYYERTYYLGAQDKGREAYAALHAALERSERAGVGRWVFHNRERTVVLRPLDDVLAIHTMRFADELVDPGDFELGRVRRKPGKQELDMAAALVEGLYKPFDPSDYRDTYRRAVLKVIEQKATGKDIKTPDEPEAEPAADLLAALEASMDGKGKRKTKGKSRSRRRAKARA
jgi:DNA end-binding protein Ku